MPTAESRRNMSSQKHMEAPDGSQAIAAEVAKWILAYQNRKKSVWCLSPSSQPLIQEILSSSAKTSMVWHQPQEQVDTYCNHHRREACKHRWHFKGLQFGGRINSSCPLERFLRRLPLPSFIDSWVNVDYDSRVWINYNYWVTNFIQKK